ncbi:glycosyltransferase family 2 protein [Arthrobacter sp. Edens01]|uniref:glycosyltransferase family 2 protein n=1 Tax=Arthrobacter sp. Edens01 TaxID=1732020 RepID=UPI0006DB16A8|nr:glycosyltransferase [Arthrobacter sp. Edens01]KPN22152.1 glycosyl transferase [Arthrobacter sp. Edens01]
MQQSDATVGIYIPFWGELEYLRVAVDSVLAQTNPDWTLTVVNDAHPDYSVDAYFATLDDPRIRYIRNELNRGITENFRRCVQMAVEPRVVVMGCDDFLLEGYVEAITKAHADHPEADLIQPGVVVVDEEGTVVAPLVDRVKQRLLRPRHESPLLLSGDKLAANLMHGNWLYWPSLAFRREAVQRHDFRDGFPVIQDLALILDVLLDGGDLLVVPDVVFAYRRHNSSASSLELLDGSRFAGERKFFEHAALLAKAKGWPRTVSAAKLHVTSRLHALVLLPGVLVRRDFRTAKVLLRHVFGS